MPYDRIWEIQISTDARSFSPLFKTPGRRTQESGNQGNYKKDQIGIGDIQNRITTVFWSDRVEWITYPGVHGKIKIVLMGDSRGKVCAERRGCSVSMVVDWLAGNGLPQHQALPGKGIDRIDLEYFYSNNGAAGQGVSILVKRLQDYHMYGIEVRGYEYERGIVRCNGRYGGQSEYTRNNSQFIHQPFSPSTVSQIIHKNPPVVIRKYS